MKYCGQAADLGRCICLKSLKLTQKEISEFSDVGRKFIIELEKGKATAQLGKVFELLNSLGLECHLIKRGDR
ncbi:helix-turn-helix domain-containing protein [Desulfobacula toluolica]|uniref:helix-turn-helix domain-containing protein n=1 Tax=Desulfobacula toluolica TaxID=28223 RepID=UPI0002D84BAB